MIIYESLATQFSVTIPSQQGLFAQTKPRVSWGSSFGVNS